MNIKKALLQVSKMREFSNKTFSYKLVYILTIFVALYHIYANIISFPDPILIRSFHAISFVTLAIYFYSPSYKNNKKIGKLDYMLIGLSIASFIYIFLNLDRLLNRIEFTDPVYFLDILFGVIFIFLVLEACRRTLGWPMIIISILSFIYTIFGQYLPGEFNHVKISFSRIIELQFSTTLGMFGLITGVSATFVFMFLLFGTVLRTFGGGDFFFNVGKKLTGFARGGAAKTAIVSSALFAMISGSANANVATTGCFTIPMMKKIGYDPSFAGAVEAAASTAGTITPPVMGATAFILANLVGIPYSEVILLGTIPSFLYYFSIFMGVDRESVRLSLKKIDVKETENISAMVLILQGIPFVVPIIYLVYRIFRGIPPQIAAFEATIFMIFLSFLLVDKKNNKNKFSFNSFIDNLKDVVNSLNSTILGVITMAVACVTGSIIVGNIYLTGLGVKFSSLIMSFAHGNIFIGVILAAVLTIIFGMGVPTAAAYILAVSLAGPALTELGIPTVHAHFFVFYYAALGTITPPVCISSYMAASIANANPMEVAWKAVTLAAGGFIVPFIFIFNPELLLEGEFIRIVIILIKVIVTLYFLNSIFFGYFLFVEYIKYNKFEIFLILFSFILLYNKMKYMSELGFLMIILVIISQFIRKQRLKGVSHIK